MSCLSQFSAASGLVPSIHKSSVFFANCKPEVVAWFDDTYHVPRGELPMKFLGVPLISSKLIVNNCIPLIDKLTSRIYNWTSLLLSFAGRAQLIKSVLFVTQAYWTNHFLLPQSIHKQMQTIFTRFLWKGDIDTKWGAKIGWQTICLPLEEGGLSFKNTKEWNEAQLMLHLCKIIRKDKSLWPLWVNSTVLKRQHFWTMTEPTDCSWIWRKLLKLRNEALHFLSYRIGNGSHISLWFDPWWQGTWRLPVPNSRHNHNQSLKRWINWFGYPTFDISATDTILWDGTPAHKLHSRHIWDAIHFKLQGELNALII